MRHPKYLLLLLVAVLGLAAVACGDDDDTSTDDTDAAATDDAGDSGDDAFPVTIDSNGTEITIEAQPTSIVSISPSGTEMLYAVGAGDAVVAVDEYSTYPADAPVTDLSSYEPNLEAILGYSPDLVIIGDSQDDVVSGLDAAGVPSLVLEAAATLDDAYTQIEKVGTATGHTDEAVTLVADMRADIEALVARVPATDTPLTYYHELDEALYSVTSNTFIGQLYALAGFENIADDVSDGNDYPQLSAEFILSADPDVIFLADAQCCGQNAETVGARAGWDTLSAVANGDIVELDEDVASRWGPRVVDLLEAIIDAAATANA